MVWFYGGDSKETMMYALKFVNVENDWTRRRF